MFAVPHNPSVEKSRALNKDLLTPQQLSHQKCMRYVKFAFFSIFLVVLVTLSVFGLYSVWNYTATRSLQGKARSTRRISIRWAPVPING